MISCREFNQRCDESALKEKIGNREIKMIQLVCVDSACQNFNSIQICFKMESLPAVT